MDNLPVYSYSKIKSFYSCKYFYFLYYCVGIKEKDKASHGCTEFGTYAHEILEKYEKDQLKADQLLKYYENNYGKNVKSSFMTYMTETYKKDLWMNYYNDGRNYFENFKGYENMTILESEYEFCENIDDLFMIRGKIDLVALDKNQDLIIIDHKSKGKFKNKQEQQEYERQLYVYSHAVFKKYGKFPKKMGFNMIRLNKIIEFEFVEEKYNETMKWIKECVEEIELNTDFNYTNGTLFCKNFCAARNMCKFYKK